MISQGLAARRGHRKRISALRLSSDSTAVPTLPRYTSPPWQRPVELVEDPSDLPPDYPSSAEDADADSESESGSGIVYNPPPPPLTFTPRRTRRAKSSARSKRQENSSDDHLDTLLARSVHALEMSNVLLQSSMSTQTTLNSVLSGDSAEADVSLEEHARTLSSRIAANNSWKEGLDQISEGVEGLFPSNAGERRGVETEDSRDEQTVSRSLPATSPISTVAARFRRDHLRRPSLDLRNASLQYSNHGRNDLIAPPPRAITMYVDTTELPDTISMPSTLGLRAPSHTLSAPLPIESTPTHRPMLLHATGSESSLPTKSALDMLSSYFPPRAGSSRRIRSNSNSRTVSPSSSFRTRPRSGSASTSTTTATRKPRSTGTRASRSPSHSPCRSVSRKTTWDAPPIIELPSASSSSSSEDLHVDATLSCLRTILQNNPPPPPPPKTVPEFLKPHTVAPVADTSHATASVSRLFTKARHTTSTRAPSPPRVSAMKGRSGRSAPPTPVSPALSLSSSWLSISDAVGIGSGRSTPNRVSFAELPDTGPKDSDRSPIKRSRSKSRGRRKGKGRDSEGSESDGGRWWTWLLGPPAGSGSSVPAYVRQEERIARSSGWGPRQGFGGSIEEWGV